MDKLDLILNLARDKGVTVTTAESCTGGLLAAALTERPGSSAVFNRGVITYSNAAKHDLLNVPTEIFEDHGAVSEACALAMAKGALSNSDAALAISITGIAGPGGSDHKPEGRVCFGVASATEQFAETQEFGAIGRDQVRALSVAHALALIVSHLEKL